MVERTSHAIRLRGKKELVSLNANRSGYTMWKIILILCLLPVSFASYGGPHAALQPHCSKTMSHFSLVQLCVPAGRSLTFQIPYSSLEYRGAVVNTGGEPGDADWYALVGQLDNSWSNCAVYSGTDWTPSLTTPHARRLKTLLSLQRTKTHLTLTVDLTNGHLDDTDETTCWILRMYAYVSGRDPFADIILCEGPPQKGSASPDIIGHSPGSRTVVFYETNTLTPKDIIFLATGMEVQRNMWLKLAQESVVQLKIDCVVCMGPRLLPHAIDPGLNSTCVWEMMSKHNSSCYNNSEMFYPIPIGMQPPPFNSEVVGNFICVSRSCSQEANANTCVSVGTFPSGQCRETFNITGNMIYGMQKQRADVWWYCGGQTLRGVLPRNWKGQCAFVCLLNPVTVVSRNNSKLTSSRVRRSLDTTQIFDAPNPTYIDAIGVPRGVPNEFKLVDQIGTGFENIPLISAIFPITPNKNVDRINYLHYNILRLTNLTRDLATALGEQMHATTMTAWQNRLAIDLLLAEKGGVCSLFGEQCCTFIPNNTAPDGSVSRAIKRLEMMSDVMHSHSGVNNPLDSWMTNMFGTWKNVFLPIFTSLLIFVSVFTLCGCCLIPCIRSLIEKTINTVFNRHPSAQMRLCHHNYTAVPLTEDEHLTLEQYPLIHSDPSEIM